jgi:hypothetical protein
LRRLGLGRLGAQPGGLQLQRGGLPLRVGPLPLAAALVGLALGQVGLPANVVDVELGAVGVQVEDLVDDLLDQVDVVADDQQPAAVGLEVVTQPGDGIRVQVVGSSSSSVCASENRMRVSSTRLRWPPDSVCSGWRSTRSGNPSEAAMDAASDSAA